MGPQGSWGSREKGYIFLRELGIFQGCWKQAQSFGDLGSPAKKKTIKKSHLKGKVSILFDFKKKDSLASGWEGLSPRPHL